MQQSSISANTQKNKIAPHIIQSSYISAKSQGKSYEMLSKTFHLMELTHKDKNLQSNQINLILDEIKHPQNQSINSEKQVLDFGIVYPLIKGGGFGTLERQCQITDKGLMQKQDKKEAILKQIKGFINKIQKYGDKANQKIDWTKDYKQYPFRIILQGDKKQSKAIFCKTEAQAQKIRIFYVNKFNYKGNFIKFMPKAQQRYRQSIVEGFKYNLNSVRANKKKLKLQRRESKMSDSKYSNFDNSQPQIQPIMSSNIQNKPTFKEDPVDKILRMSSSSKQQAYQSKAMDYLVKKQEKKIPSQSLIAVKINPDLFFELQKQYRLDLFENWKIKAKNKQKIAEEHKKSRVVTDNKFSEIFMNNSKITNFQAESRMSNNNQNNRISSKNISGAQISFTKIQFLRQTNILIKPIVSLSVQKQGRTVYQCVFNTMIRSKSPHLSYSLIPTSGQSNFVLNEQIQNYDVTVQAVDYLTNEKLCNDKISLKNKLLSQCTLLLNLGKVFRVQMKYENNQNKSSYETVRLQDNPEGNFLQIEALRQKNVNKIKKYWEQQSIRKGYYSATKDIKIIQILELCEEIPTSWSLGLSQKQYQIISYLQVAAKILNFKLIPSFINIIKVLQEIYSDIQELIQVCLSIVTNYIHSYYYVELFTKIDKLQRSLNINGEIDFSSKIWLQMSILKKIVQIQSPDLEDRMNRKNIAYCFLLYQYIYEIYSRVFPIKTLTQIWNFIFRDQENIRIYLLLIGVWLMRFYSQKILKCRRFKELSVVFESKQLCVSEIIIKELLVLREKYFGEQNKGIIQQIRGFFNNKPLENISNNFYKRESSQMTQRKEAQEVEKQTILHNLSKQLDIQLPNYSQKRYCFHIYFYRLPTVQGSLYLKGNGIQYECLNYEQNSYFIIGQINTPISVSFISKTSNQYTAKLSLVQGINKFTTYLISSSHNKQYQIQYLCGLLTTSQIEAFKNNKKFQYYLAPFMKQQELYDQLLRPVNQSNFLNSYSRRLETQDLGRKLKIIFSAGNKNFDEIEFYLRWISTSPLTLFEKLKLIKRYAQNISSQFYLSKNRQLQKMFISQFLRMIKFPIQSLQLECLYADSIDSEFEASKLLKCRLFTPSGKQYKLEHTANNYYIKKINEGFYGDLIITELIDFINNQAQSELSNINEGNLSLLYSSNGEVHHVEIPVVRKKTSKKLVVNQEKYELDNPSHIQNISFLQPQILVTQILPTFSKITTILDYVNQPENKSAESFQRKRQDKLDIEKKIPENLNILKKCEQKFSQIILMRYSDYPNQLRIPFLSYYHDLVFDIKIPTIPRNIYLNNTKTDIRTVCCMKTNLQFSDNKRIEATKLDNQLGLFGNLRILPPKTESLYFTTYLKGDIQPNNALLFINYGYGIFRWEPCIVIGFTHYLRNKQSGLKEKRQPKKLYLVKHREVEQFHREVQLRIDPEIEQNLLQLDAKAKIQSSLHEVRSKKPQKNIALSRLIGSNF